MHEAGRSRLRTLARGLGQATVLSESTKAAGASNGGGHVRNPRVGEHRVILKIERHECLHVVFEDGCIGLPGQVYYGHNLQQQCNSHSYARLIS